MYKILNILIILLFVNVIYPQTCTADAGDNLNIILPHNGSPGGDVTFDATGTSGDFSNFQWEIYHLPIDTLAYTTNGSNPTIDINCYTSLNGDDTWTDCIADYRVELTVTCDNGSTSLDNIDLSITEENDPPIACLSTQFDSYLENEALLIPNNTGIPGEQTTVFLFEYLLVDPFDPLSNVCPQPDEDQRFWLWWDEDGNSIVPVVPRGEGIYIFTHQLKDLYQTYSELTLTLELDEENTLPSLSIAAINSEDLGLDHVIIDSDDFDLFGIITDVYNDVDDVDGDGIDDDIIYTWNYEVVPNEVLAIINPNSLNPTITAPSINSNVESSEITITLEAQDPFQVLDDESTISDPIIITVVNDNQNPTITNSIEGYEIIEDGSSELNYSNIDDYIDVSDTDENTFTLAINQSDIDLDLVTYANYSLVGETTIDPDDDYYGQIVVPVRVNDGYMVSDTCYNCLSELANLVIDIIGVNDAPEITAPETLDTDEDLDLTITQVSVEDVDSESTGPNNFNLQFEISVDHGTLSLSENTGSINYSDGDGTEDASMIFTASVTDFNNAISEAIFHPEENYYGSDAKIIVAVNDLGNNGIQDGANPVELTDSTTININIENVNDPPVITATDNYSIDEDEENFHLIDIVFSDDDVADGQMILELTVSNGTLQLSSTDGIVCLEGECNSDVSNMEYRGTLDILNNSIQNLHYVPVDNYNGVDIIEIRLNDMGNVGNEELEDIKNITVNIDAINDPPFITSSLVFSDIEDTQFNVENISVEDPDVNEGNGTLEITINCPECKVSLPLPIIGLNFSTGNGTENNSMVFTGNLNDINTAIDNINIIGNENFCGFTNLQITANDLGNHSNDPAELDETHTINISIELEETNDPPVNEDPVTGIEVLPIVSFSEDALSLSTTDGLWNDLLDEEYSLANCPSPSGICPGCGPASIITYQYQWQRCAEEEEEDCTHAATTDIIGAESDSYDITSDDADNFLRSRVIATDDGYGLPLFQSDTVYASFVKMDNLPPYVISTSSEVTHNSYEDSTYVFSLIPYVEDPDNNDLSFSIENDIDENHGSITLDENTGEVEFEPSEDINYNSIGYVEFTYRVSDFQYTCSDPGTIKIKILPQNDAPLFNTIDENGNVFANENEENIIRQWADPASINDGDEEDIQELDFIIESISNELLFNNEGAGPIINIDSFTGELTFELVDNSNGSSDIIVVLQDNGGTNNYPGLDVSEFDTSESFQFTIDVTAINDPPVFNPYPYDIIIDEDYGSYDPPDSTFIDPASIDDGDPELDQQYEFILDVIGEADTMFIDLPQIDPSSGDLSFTAGPDMNGEIFIEVYLDDDGNNIAPSIDISELDTFKIIINAINDAPTFSIDIEDQIIGDENIIYEDSGTQTFGNFAKEIYDGDPLSNSTDIQEVEFILIDLGNPDLFSIQPYIDDNGTLTFTPAENENGQSSVQIILTDLEGTPNGGIDESIPQTFTIVITPLNDPPFFNLEHEETQLADGEELIRFEDFSDPNTISIASIRYGTPTDEESPNQSVVFTIDPQEAINDNEEVFTNISIVPSSGEITIEMIPHGNGQSSFTVKATDSGPGDETGNGDVNIYTQSFDLTINPLADHPQIDLDDPTSLIEPVGLQVDSLIGVYHGTWIDTIDTDMSGASNIVGYEYLWQAADNIDDVDDVDNDGTDIEGLYDIGGFHADSIDYIITDNEAHKYIRSIVKAFDDGWGDIAVPGVDDRFTDTTDWIQVLNTKPVVVNDLEYFTWEDVPLTIEVIDGLISNDVSDTTTDYDKDLDSIWINVANIEVPSVWGQLDIFPDGHFYFDPSPPDPENPNPDENFHALSDTFGIISFTYQLIDEYGATSNNLGQVQIEVGSLNDAPEFSIQDQDDGTGNEIDTIEVLEDFEEIKLGFSIPGHLPLDEVESQTVLYSIDHPSVDFAELSFDESNGTIEISSKPDWNTGALPNGLFSFIVTATDDGLGEETGNGDDNDHSEIFHVKIVPVNDVPIFSLLGDTITILEDRGLFDTLNWIINPDVGAILEDHQNLHYNISYVNDTDVNGTVWTFNSDPQIMNDYDLNFQVSDDDNGLSEVTITVQDDGGTTVDYFDDENYEVGVNESDTQTFFVKVLPVNDVPTYTQGDDKVLNEDSGLVNYEDWITDISSGPSNESFQHKDLVFNISAFDKFGNLLEGINSNSPNNVLFKTAPVLTIDSVDTTKAHLSFELNENHNGLATIQFNLNDQSGTEYSGVESSLYIQKHIFVRQLSDQAEDFIVYPKPHEYAIDPTTFFIDTTDIEYFRLPYQDFAPDVQTPKKMRFSWERNDSLDVDTYSTTNLDSLFATYYRLEMDTDSSDYTYVLFDFFKDSSEYINNLFFNDSSYFVDINMNSQFPAYLDTFVFDNNAYDTTLYIDTTGLTEYTWNVVTQNYSRDIYNHDKTNNTTSNRNVVVDLEVPVAQYSFMENDLYEEYYDLYFKTSEETIENVASIWIDFSDTSLYRVPHKIDDYYFHLSSIFINTGIINYNFQVRDLVENIGKSEKTIIFQFLDEGLSKSIYSPNNLFSLHSSKNSVDEKTGIILFSDNSMYNSVELIQLTSEYHIFPYNQQFLDPISIEFDNIDINNDSWKYTVRYKENDEWIEIDTDLQDNKIIADILNGGIYSVFYNENALPPVPEKFELVNLYPNPFNPILTIRYNLDFEQRVSIDIYNILGQRVNHLFDQKMVPGYHSIQWNGTNNQGVLLGSGIYFIKIATKNKSYTGKVSFIK